MGDFKRNKISGGSFGGGNRSFGGGNRSFGGGSRGGFGGRDRVRPEMHKAICDECGSKCEVPFRPSGDKPVLCSECFGNAGGAKERGGRGDRRDRGERRDDRGERRMHQATCAECGSKCEVPFRPSGDKPVLCSECFGGGKNPAQDKSPQTNEKYDEIISKLDKIITLLQRTNSVKEVIVMKEKKEDEVVKTAEKKTPAKKTVVKKTAPKKAVKKPADKKKTATKKK